MFEIFTLEIIAQQAFSRLNEFHTYTKNENGVLSFNILDLHSKV